MHREFIAISYSFQTSAVSCYDFSSVHLFHTIYKTEQLHGKKKNTGVTLRDYKNTIDKGTDYRMCEVAKVAKTFELALLAYRVTFFHCIVFTPSNACLIV